MSFGEAYTRPRRKNGSPFGLGFPWKAMRWVGFVFAVAFMASSARADFTKTITVTPGVKTQAVATWDYFNCSTLAGVGSYTVSVAPSHGTLAYGQVSGVIPGCPSGSPSLAAEAAYYTWTGGTTGATSDYFQLFYSGPTQSGYIDITVLLAGPPADVFKVNYFSNNIAAAPDATLRIDNPGLTYANLCALIYVFDADQQLSECCGCTETHNGLRTLSVRSNLTSNPLTGVVSTSGMIKIISSLPGATGCDPTANVSPTANLRAWVTHIDNPVGPDYPVTETESSDSTLGTSELSNLQAQCAFVRILGSGQGTCTCGTGD
jgi:hypothetical protein